MKIQTLLLWVLCLVLLAASPKHPWPDWQWPCYIFSLGVCLFLLKDAATILAELINGRSKPRGTDKDSIVKESKPTGKRFKYGHGHLSTHDTDAIEEKLSLCWLNHRIGRYWDRPEPIRDESNYKDKEINHE
jgi:hypothetical protein